MLKRMLATLLVLASLQLPAQACESEPETADRLHQSLALIHSTRAKGEGFGTGFIIESNGRMMTSAHVIEGSKSIKALLPDGRVQQYTVQKSLGMESVATLVPTQPQVDLPYLSFASAMPAVGESVRSMGYPFVLDAFYTSGIMSSPPVMSDGAEIFRMNFNVYPGASGSPVVNCRGQVIGVVLAYLSDTGMSVANTLSEVAKVQ